MVVSQNSTPNNLDNSSFANNYIAMVDDDKDLLEMYSGYLMLDGFKTITFEKPHRLLEYI